MKTLNKPTSVESDRTSDPDFPAHLVAARDADHESPTACQTSDASSPPAAYEEALNYLIGRINYEKIGLAPYSTTHYRLDRMRQLLDLLGNPQLSYPILHVAGTKGKGTTATLLAGALASCGYTTGLYTSPHLAKIEERFQVNGKICTSAEFITLVDQVRAAAIRIESDGVGRPTFFELTTAMGMLFFASREVDCAVLEVGMGGRLDSTNVCNPVVSVITSISLDHQAQLGNTVAAIAAEKAGIIKPSTPVVCVARDAAARQVIATHAQQQHAELRQLQLDFDVQWRELDPSSWHRESPTAEVEFLPKYHGHIDQASPTCSRWITRMLGKHQADNLAAAVATLDVLAAQGWSIDAAAARFGLRDALPPLRFEMISRDPLRVIDVAHNPASIAAGIAALDDHFVARDRTVIFASSRDKDYRLMLRFIIPNCRRLILTNYLNNPRGLPVGELSAACRQTIDETCADGRRPAVYSAPTPASAWELAEEHAAEDEIIYATGSFFLAAELMHWIRSSKQPFGCRGIQSK